MRHWKGHRFRGRPANGTSPLCWTVWRKMWSSPPAIRGSPRGASRRSCATTFRTQGRLGSRFTRRHIAVHPFAILADEDPLTGEGQEEFAVATRAESGLSDHGRMAFPVQVSANRPKRLRLVGQFQRGSQATTIPAPPQSVVPHPEMFAMSEGEECPPTARESVVGSGEAVQRTQRLVLVSGAHEF